MLDDVDLSLRPQPDCESLVFHLLHEFTTLPAWENVAVESEVTPITDTDLHEHPIILYQVGQPTLESHTMAWEWTVPLTLTVLTFENPDRAWSLASQLDMAVRTWPFHNPTKWGEVVAVTSDGGFARQQFGNIVTSKAASQYGADKELLVAAPH